MKSWVDLYRAQRDVRSLSSSTWTDEIRKRLIALSKAGHCDTSVKGRFTYKHNGSLLEWSIRDGSSTAPLPLQKIPDLTSAELSLMALADRSNHLHQFTVMVEGKRADGSAWALAVHFEDDRVTEKNPGGDRKGTGACGHAAFHCHVGPGLDVAPKVRVPLPAVGPVEALDWVLSQLVPTSRFEPAPWAQVQAALKKASA
ncbi:MULTISPECIES: hypothetical protein [Sorangium]|uniref:Uncharacterized protein n=1 Tax=Sorangium cellulosum TaxID=56 RepID=A0A4P2QIW9_SORCE|nr:MULTISPECIES: hypothetical protein [Sorangium]AUX29551.1 uncharacterized protein SOCE836_016420 [Sorangium cellulosum]WCQ88947.1 hypothetical protein NQZ70_01630 [Sorangium sp. Soce836]